MDQERARPAGRETAFGGEHDLANRIDGALFVGPPSFVTFWQVSADLALAVSMPPDHGHICSGEHVDGWAAIRQPNDWSADMADQLRDIILEAE